MNEKTWNEIGAGETADSLIHSGGIPPLLIVMPRERRDARFGDALVNDILPYVDSRYRTLADRDHRALGGMSRGAGWALRVGLQNPGLFSALGLHSLGIFYADEAKVGGWLDKLPPDLTPRFYIDIGDNDSLIVSAGWLDRALTRRGLAHDYHLNPGSHTRAYWTERLPDYLRWYTANW
jgi:enterochelin esterase-like enzyme